MSATEDGDLPGPLQHAPALLHIGAERARQANTALHRVIAMARRHGATDDQITEWTGLAPDELARVYPLACAVLEVVRQ